MADLRGGSTSGGYIVLTNRNIDDTNITSNRFIWSAKKSEQVRAQLQQTIDDLRVNVDVVGNLGYTPANKAGDTFGGAVIAPTIKLVNSATDTTNNRISVYDSGSASYGMMLWNNNGTSGDWSTMIYTGYQANTRISFGKINSTSFSSHSHVTEMGYFDGDDESLNIKKLNNSGDMVFTTSGRSILGGSGGDLFLGVSGQTTRFNASNNGHFYFSNVGGVDTFARVEVQATTGKIGFGSGSATRDVWLERYSDNTLKISDNVVVGKELSVLGTTNTIGGTNFNNGWLKIGTPLGGIAIDNNEVVSFGSELNLTTNGNNPICINTNNAERFRVNGDGKIGIGTTSPASRLHLVSNNTGSGFCDEGGILLEGTHTTDGELGIMFKNVSTGANRWFSGLNQSNRYEIAYGSTFDNGNTRFTITGGGNVGISNISPTCLLHVGSSSVSGNSIVRIESQANAGLELVADTDNGTEEKHNPYVSFSQDGGATTSIMGNVGATNMDPRNATYTGVIDNSFMIGTTTANNLQIGTSSNVRMTFTSDGKIGVGTNAPLSSFHIANSGTGLRYGMLLRNHSNVLADSIGLGFSVDSLATNSIIKGAIAFERVGPYSSGKFHILMSNTQNVTDVGLSDSKFSIEGDGTTSIAGSTLKVGSSSTVANFNDMGFSNLSTVRFMNNERYWVGAGNSYWYLNSANNGETTTKHHDLLLTTSKNEASGTETGITFGVATNDSGTSGYRLGRWYSRTNSATSMLFIDGKLGVGIAVEELYRFQISGDMKLTNPSDNSKVGKLVGNLQGSLVPTNTSEINTTGASVINMFYRDSDSTINEVIFWNGKGTSTGYTKVSANTFESKVTNASPFVVNSTTMVSRLNAEYVGGKTASTLSSWSNLTNVPSPTISITGAATGSATMTNLGSTTIKVRDISIKNVAENKSYNLVYNETYNSLDFVYVS